MNNGSANSECPRVSKSLSIPLICALLLAATFAAYWRALDNGFVTFFDDGIYITSNPHVQAGLSSNSIAWALTSMRCANWHPVTWVSHMADCSLYRLMPTGHHLTSILIHAVTTLLLFLLLNRLTKSQWRSAFVAALFAVHPLHVESVAWIAERKDVLSALFLVLIMWAYVWYTERPSTRRYLLLASAFALGLMSKPMLVTLPLLLLLLDYWPLGRSDQSSMISDQLSVISDQSGSHIPSTKHRARWHLLLEKAPLLMLSAASCMITFVAQRQSLAVGSLDEMGMGMRVSNALVTYVSYIGKALWPMRLGAFYPYPMHPFPAWQVAGSALLIIAITLLVCRYGKTHRYLPVGWLWYLGTLVPVIGLMQVGAQAMADRYTYIPLIGIFIMVAWGIPESLGVWGYGGMGEEDSNTPKRLYSRTWPLAVAAVVAIMALTVRAHDQARYWRDSVTLLQHAVDITTDNYPAHLLLGNALAGEGKYDDAVGQFHMALKIAPEYALAHDSLGAVLASQGKLGQAEKELRESVRLYPGYAEAHRNLGKVLAKQKRWPEAAAEYQASLQLQPDSANAHNNLGNVYLNQGNLRNAIAEYREALRLDPNLKEAKDSLDAALQGRTGNAGQFAEAVHHYNAGVALQSQDKIDQAIHEYQQALQARPEFAQAHSNLALAYFDEGKFKEAWKEVHLCRKYGAEPHPGFIQALAERMPDPQKRDGR